MEISMPILSGTLFHRATKGAHRGHVVDDSTSTPVHGDWRRVVTVSFGRMMP
jgi:hypothetical protein